MRKAAHPPAPAGLTKHLPAVTIAAMFLAGVLHGPVGQLANYHAFADHTVLFGIPHACDVLSNLGFALVALWGLHRINNRPPRHGDAGYRLFLFGLLLTALGSTHYHLAPDDARLVWDRVPIALACAGLLAGFRGDFFRRDATLAALGLGSLAIASVAWWRLTGDLRPYLLFQIAPIVLIPLWQWIGKAAAGERRAAAAGLALYAIAKWAELNDHEIATIAAPLTGHTLKHLLATAAAAVFVSLVTRNNFKKNRGSAARQQEQGSPSC
jgi:hypothetical protein